MFLIYFTFTISIVELEEDIYENIFGKEMYEKYPQETWAPYETGFLIDDNNELKKLEKLRVQTLEANKADST